jgi:tetratricopeptide (TPR) repeat protein
VDSKTVSKSDTVEPVTDPVVAKTLFDKAVEDYDAGNFESAAESFRALLPKFSSAKLHYDLANTLYRLREYPRSILHFERAFALDPTNPDIRANLNLAREAASIDTPDPAILAVVGHRFSWSTWTWFLSVGFWGLAAVLLLFRPARLPNLWRNGLILLFGIILAISILAQITWFSTANQAIVLIEDTPLRIAPTATSPLENRLPAGSAVKAQNSYGDFIRVKLDDGTQGWVLQSSVERVRPE